MPGGMMIPAGRNMPAAGRIGGLASYAASLGQVTRQSSSPGSRHHPNNLSVRKLLLRICASIHVLFFIHESVLSSMSRFLKPHFSFSSTSRRN